MVKKKAKKVPAVEGHVEAFGQEDINLSGAERKMKYDNKDYKKYNAFIKGNISKVDKKIKEMRKIVQDKYLDREVVGELLINLRYLIKDNGFKYEQECRIIKICRLFDEREKFGHDESYRLYIEYEPKVSEHVEKVYFGPNATDKEKFEDYLTHNGLKIPCERLGIALASEPA